MNAMLLMIALYLNEHADTGRPYVFDTSRKVEPNLFTVANKGTNVVQITWDGNVIYDTNHVTEATRLFWNSLSRYLHTLPKP